MAPRRAPSPATPLLLRVRERWPSSGRTLLGAVTIATALLGVLGCGAPTVSLREGSREYVATDYDNVLDRWTRTESIYLYSELERALTVTATFESWDFRWAYVVRYGNDYRLTVAQRQRLLDQTLEETKQAHHFFVALYGGNPRQYDLTSAASAWIVRLIDSTGNETAPDEIVAIRKPSLLERRYYPYNTVWRQAFRVRFPQASGDGRPTMSADATWIGLRFAGAKGNTDLIWDLEQPSEPAGGGAEAGVSFPTPRVAARAR